MPQGTLEMLQTHPNPASVFDLNALAECIDACFGCENSCTSCADACLGEGEHTAHLVHCIRLNLDCADVCAATGRVLSRLTQPDQNLMRAQLQACLAACQACGAECERHVRDMDMRHCAVCAQSCRRCEEACQALLSAMPA